jgi:death on curing protein
VTAGDDGWNWITKEVAIAAHDVLVSEFGGPAGIRDLNALESALGRPRNLAAYKSPDLAALAAAYAFGLIRNHAFTDGNKRTGYTLALAFLLDNGAAFIGTDAESVETMLAVAAGELSEDDLATWFRARLQPKPQP